LEDFIRNSLLPLVVPMNRETVKMLNDDGRKVVLMILQDDESDENSPRLIKVLRSAASANRDLVFGYVGVNQWEEFTETFDVKSSELPTMIVWDKKEEYEIVSRSIFTFLFQNKRLCFFLMRCQRICLFSFLKFNSCLILSYCHHILFEMISSYLLLTLA
jgi:hypothetical protein